MLFPFPWHSLPFIPPPSTHASQPSPHATHLPDLQESEQVSLEFLDRLLLQDTELLCLFMCLPLPLEYPLLEGRAQAAFYT